MKKVLTSLMVIASISAFAQTEKGTWMLGGSAGISSSESHVALDGASREISSSSLSFSPNIGIFAAERFAIGLTFSFTRTNTEVPHFEIDSKNTGFGIGPSFRYYFPVDENWAVFPTVSYVHQTNTFTTSQFDPGSGGFFEDKQKEKSNLITLGGGISYFLNNNIGVEGILDYKYSNNEGTNTTGTFSFNVGFQIYFAR